MKRLSQAEAVQQLSGSQLKIQLYLSQLLLLLLAFGLSLWLFPSFHQWLELVSWNEGDLLFYGLIPGLIIVLTDLILMRWLPEQAFDDGGLNKKLFTNSSVVEVLIIALIVAVSEEALFRGVLQTEFGYLTASVIFALVHVRYLTKPYLLLSIVLISFYFGWLYELTGNLLVTIAAHFVVDFILGMLLRNGSIMRGGMKNDRGKQQGSSQTSSKHGE
ncbi:CPBP family intramembrane metalloprotease [Sediminibacillus dalangtanensis]|uniref:CPBP family intramembrane metalloprotease n=1 Tax=Sediminibacillus dalangtanensis TaxID=2729421 RepID=A0ABX7VYH5_9BACI|nr:CPBP family intramembrane glutamic endopeptidase [Sediminibacillus dalangtanensis]QTM99686.1 CPBP family intramembrane metalloprotease [Sediminibacillus dalangtanensis]